ncbi:MAG: lysine 2,3-aminomutase [Clostridium sp. SCN 57-10]|nr:MAG: lysine 2,3-aminomutase [Clostridium sp. SCN 57-10]
MDWKTSIKDAIKTPAELRRRAPALAKVGTRLDEVAERFPMCVPDYYLSLIDPSDPDDPIARLCIPSDDELRAGGAFDTSGEAENTKLDGLQHKYSQTAMVLSTNRCAMYCRHCFRKRMVGLSEEETLRRFDEMADYIARHDEITNVLISGGDAFMNSASIIAHYLERLSAMPHIQMVRFGTRIPVVLPQRITEDNELLTVLEEYGKQLRLYVVTQFNHPRELTEQAQAAVDALMRRGVTVSNQTVLLRGVNDDADTLEQLMNGLTRVGIVPYYVFQCRPVRGVQDRFQVPLHRALAIVEEAKSRLNGHAKRFRFVMSHVTGKLEILGELPDGRMLFQYHQAKHPDDHSRVFAATVAPEQLWLDEIPPVQA